MSFETFVLKITQYVTYLKARSVLNGAAGALWRVISLRISSPLSEIVTWLILPVVICLSQRLSHACLSLSNKRWNCEWLIKSVIVYLMVPYYMDNCGNSRANTCRKISTSGRDVFIRSKTNGLRVSLVNHDNCSNRMALRRRCFIQISALSDFRWYGSGLPWFWRVTGNKGSIPERGPEKRPSGLRTRSRRANYPLATLCRDSDNK